MLKGRQVMDIYNQIETAAASLKGISDDLTGGLGGLDDYLLNEGSFSLTLAVLALLNPRIDFENALPVATFAGSEESIVIDCFHVELIHHGNQGNVNDDIYTVIGNALAEAWNRVLTSASSEGYFTYHQESGDVVYSA